MTDASTPAKRFMPMFKGIILLASLLILSGFLYFLYTQYSCYRTTQHRLADLESSIEKNQQALNKLQIKQNELADSVQKQSEQQPLPDALLSTHYNALVQFDQKLDTLQIPNTLPQQNTLSTEEESTSYWSAFKNAFKHIWSQLVRVHSIKNDYVVITEPLKKLIILTMHSDIAVAKWALINNQPAIYHSALSNIHHTLTMLFPSHQDIIDQLKQLDSVTFNTHNNTPVDMH